MLDHALESAFVTFLQADPGFAEIHFFTGHDDEEHHMPAITVSSKSEPLAGSAEVFRAEVTLLIESEAHDSKPDNHAVFVEKVRARFARKADVVASINAGNRTQLVLQGRIARLRSRASRMPFLSAADRRSQICLRLRWRPMTR